MPSREERDGAGLLLFWRGLARVWVSRRGGAQKPGGCRCARISATSKLNPGTPATTTPDQQSRASGVLEKYNQQHLFVNFRRHCAILGLQNSSEERTMTEPTNMADDLLPVAARRKFLR